MRRRTMEVKRLPCAACIQAIEISPGHRTKPTGLPIEEQHLSLGGHAGQRRRGNDFTIPLCVWHHRGDPADGRTASYMTVEHGPSYARLPTLFRTCYGKDDALLAWTNTKLDELRTLRVGA